MKTYMFPMKSTEYGALTLAYIGDAVYELKMRLAYPDHRETVRRVCAEAQSLAFNKIEPFLLDDELSAYKRGRNAKVNSVPQHASVEQYHRATGLEALFGFLYIEGRHQRIDELFDIIIHD